MSTGISSATSSTVCSRITSNTRIIRSFNSSSSSPIYFKSTNYGRKSVLLQHKLILPRNGFRCNCRSTPGGPAPGDNDNKRVLDAFFLGKALAEALNERIESTVGEFLSTVGRLQAEQQKQVQDFQDEVLERAQRAKEKAAREAMEAQGLLPKSSPSNFSASIKVSSAIDEPTISASTSENQSPTNSTTDPLLGISIDD